MKFYLSLSILLMALYSSAQCLNRVEYIFPKSIDSAIERGVKAYGSSENLYIELKKNKDDSYLIDLRRYLGFSADKIKKIESATRYCIHNSKDYSIWFEFDDTFGNIQSVQDIAGNAYTVVFTLEGRIVDEYRQQ